MPFIHMLGGMFTDTPIVEISVDRSLTPETEWALGAAVGFRSRFPGAKLNAICREKGVLTLAVGLGYYNLGDFQGLSVPYPATPESHEAIIGALQKTDVRLSVRPPLCVTSLHTGFRLSHPRAGMCTHIMAGGGDYRQPIGSFPDVLCEIAGLEFIWYHAQRAVYVDLCVGGEEEWRTNE